MLQAPTSDRKTKPEAGSKTTEHLSEQEQPNHLSGWMGRSRRSQPQQRDNLAAMQNAYGNQAVLRMQRSQSMNSTQGGILQRKCGCGGTCTECQKKQELPLQTKLSISEPGDKYEQEADRVAEQVMRMPTPDSQTRVPLANSNLPLVSHQSPLQRQEVKEEKEKGKIQAKEESGQTLQVTSELEERLQASQGKGQPLPQDTRSFMESRFGHDFSQVRVHTSSEAVQMNQLLKAQAFTHKQDVYFGEGKAPGNDALTAHELTHVVQQTDVTQTKRIPTVQRSTVSEVKHGLTSDRFKGDPALEACYADQTRLTKGAKGTSVVKIQQALIDLGYDLDPTGADGDYGTKTWNAVKQFKADQHLGWEQMGDVGPGTMGRLNELFPPTSPPSQSYPIVVGKDLRLKAAISNNIQAKEKIETSSVNTAENLQILRKVSPVSFTQISSIQLKPSNDLISGANKSDTFYIPWKGSYNSSLYVFFSNFMANPQEAAKLTNILVAATTEYSDDGKEVSLTEFNKRVQKKGNFKLNDGLKQIIRDYLKVDDKGLEQLRKDSELGGKAQDLFGRDPMEKGEVGSTNKGDKRGLAGPKGIKVEKDWSLLSQNPELAKIYVQLMEAFANIDNAKEVESAAAKGLSEEDINRLIIKGDNKKSYLTSIFTVGYRDFEAASGNDLKQFRNLEERIFEQITWGNVNAARNQLKIGKGWPEQEILGIVNRTTGMLWYGKNYEPLVSPSLTTYRDSEYVGAPPPNVGINLAAFTDPALRGFLNALRQQSGDPAKQVAMGAAAYIQNIDEINKKVKQKLAEQGGTDAKQALAEMIPMMFGFYLGDQAAKLCLTMQPPFPALGAALEVAIMGAGYYFKIDMWGSALKRIILAGYHLIRISGKPDQSQDSISKYHFDAAIETLYSLALDIAIMVGIEVALATIKAGQKLSIGCESPCDFECEGKEDKLKPNSKPATLEEARASEKLDKLKTESQVKIEDLSERNAASNKTVEQLSEKIKIKQKTARECLQEAGNAERSKQPTGKGQKLINELTTPEEKVAIEEEKKAGVLKEWQIQKKVLAQKAEQIDSKTAGHNSEVQQLEKERGSVKSIAENTQNEINDLKGITKIPKKAGGSYNDVYAKANVPGGEVNHAPNKGSYLGITKLTKGDGPSIWMTKADHGRLESTINPEFQLRQQELVKDGKFREAFENEIADIRSKNPDGRYEKGIEQARNYLNSIDPALLIP
jgi:peptidoglycan hydrolase-like protein with peptidoglycan-binding domain